MSWMAVAVVGSAVVGGVVASNSADKQTEAATAANQAQIDANAKLPQNDPRIAQYLYGNGTQQLKPGTAPSWGMPDANGQQMSTNPQSDYVQNNGLLGQYMTALNKPQDAAVAGYGKTAGDYLTQNGAGDLNAIRNGALQQMQGNDTSPRMSAVTMESVPQAQAAKYDNSYLKDFLANAPSIGQTAATKAATVNAPSQNNVDLSKAYQDMIYGDPGSNPFLTGAIDKGIHQSQNAFGQMQRDATQNFNESIMPGLRGGALLSGQYGGTRQGIAEGRAASDYSKNEQRAIQQMNQYNTDAAVAAQAQAYREDMDRKAQLMQSLGGQQYGVANTNAANQQSAYNQTSAQNQQTNMANGQLSMQAYLASLNDKQQAAQAQGSWDQQANLANQNAAINVGQANMGAKNSAGNANLQSQLTTNQLNSNNLQTGMANLGGLLGNAYSTAGTQDQYDLTKMNNGMNALSNYLAKNGSSAPQQPVYNNSAAAGLGGALMGAQLGSAVYNGTQSNFGGSGVANPLLKGAANGYGTGAAAGGGGNFYDGYGWGT